jgi:hypothetical protein
MIPPITIDWTIKPAEFLALISFIAGVIYFIIQRRADRRKDLKTANREIYQKLELASIDLFRFDAGSSKVTGLLWAENQSLPKEGTTERYAFLNYVCQILNLFEMSIRFRKENIMPAEVFGSWVIWYYDLFSRPNFLPIWKEVKLNYTCDLRRVVDKCIEIESEIENEQEQKERFFRFVANEVHDHKFVLNMLFCGDEKEGMKKCLDCPSNPRKKGLKINASEISMSWYTEASKMKEAARFFVANVDQNYISHGEIFDGRALDFNTWCHDLAGYMENEFKKAAATPSATETEYRLAMARKDKSIVGIAFLALHKTGTNPYVELSDIVIKRSMIAKGIGSILLAWIEQEMAKTDIPHLFLESSMKNKKGQNFFTDRGFHIISKVMVKKIRK